jgi:predicted metalloenzyme YecM
MWHFIAGMVAGTIAYRLSKSMSERAGTISLIKYAEIIAIMTLAESRQLRHQSLAIAELVYKDADKNEEYEKIKLLINNKYEYLERSTLARIKKTVVYKVGYNTLDEAVKQLAPLIKIVSKILENRK